MARYANMETYTTVVQRNTRKAAIKLAHYSKIHEFGRTWDFSEFTEVGLYFQTLYDWYTNLQFPRTEQARQQFASAYFRGKKHRKIATIALAQNGCFNARIMCRAFNKLSTLELVEPQSTEFVLLAALMAFIGMFSLLGFKTLQLGNKFVDNIDRRAGHLLETAHTATAEVARIGDELSDTVNRVEQRVAAVVNDMQRPTQDTLKAAELSLTRASEFMTNLEDAVALKGGEFSSFLKKSEAFAESANDVSTKVGGFMGGIQDAMNYVKETFISMRDKLLAFFSATSPYLKTFFVAVVSITVFAIVLRIAHHLFPTWTEALRHYLLMVLGYEAEIESQSGEGENDTEPQGFLRDLLTLFRVNFIRKKDACWEFLGELPKLASIGRAIEWFISNAVFLFHWAVECWTGKPFGRNKTEVEMQEFIDRVDLYASVVDASDSNEQLTDGFATEEIGLIAESERMAQLARTSKDVRALYCNLVAQKRSILTQKVAIMTVRRRAIKLRPVPVWLYLYGPPGCGKSDIQSKILTDVFCYINQYHSELGIFKDISDFSQTVLYGTMGEEYYDGYAGQTFHVIDDLFQNKAVDSRTMASNNLINWCSSSPCSLLVASPGKKGGVFYRSRFLLTSSNLSPKQFPTANLGLEDVSALTSRITFPVYMDGNREFHMYLQKEGQGQPVFTKISYPELIQLVCTAIVARHSESVAPYNGMEIPKFEHAYDLNLPRLTIPGSVTKKGKEKADAPDAPSGDAEADAANCGSDIQSQSSKEKELELSEDDEPEVVPGTFYEFTGKDVDVMAGRDIYPPSLVREGAREYRAYAERRPIDFGTDDRTNATIRKYFTTKGNGFTSSRSVTKSSWFNSIAPQSYMRPRAQECMIKKRIADYSNLPALSFPAPFVGMRKHIPDSTFINEMTPLEHYQFFLDPLPATEEDRIWEVYEATFAARMALETPERILQQAVAHVWASWLSEDHLGHEALPQIVCQRAQQFLLNLPTATFFVFMSQRAASNSQIVELMKYLALNISCFVGCYYLAKWLCSSSIPKEDYESQAAYEHEVRSKDRVRHVKKVPKTAAPGVESQGQHPSYSVYLNNITPVSAYVVGQTDVVNDVLKAEPYRSAWGLFPCGKWLCLPQHIYRKPLSEGKRVFIRVGGGSWGSTSDHEITNVQKHCIASDMWAVRLDSINDHRDIRGHFAEVLPNFGKISLARTKLEDKHLELNVASALETGETWESTPYAGYTYSMNMKMHDIVNAPGMCGMIYTSFAVGKIVGFHLGGQRDPKIAYAVNVTKADFDCLSIESQCLVPIHCELKPHGGLPGIRVLGTVDRAFGSYIPRDSQLTLSQLDYKSFPVPETDAGPAHLSPVDGVSPLRVAVEKFGDVHSPPTRIPPLPIHKLIPSTLDYDSASKFLTMEEAIYGIEGYIKSMDMRTSSGYFWKKKNLTRKQLFFDSEGNRRIHPELRRDVEHKWWLFDLDAICPVVYEDTLKDEIRSKKKLDTLSTRLFTSGDLTSLIIQKMVLGRLIEELKKDPVNTPIGLSLNPHSKEWGMLRNRLRSSGRKPGAGDFGKYDITLIWEIVEWYCSFMSSFYEASNRAFVIRVIKANFLGWHVMGTLLYERDQGTNSGSFITSHFNSTANWVLHMTAFKALYPDSDDLETTFTGDDSIFGALPEHDAYDMSYLQRFFRENFGMEYTSPNKDDNMFVTWDDLVYLKRKFVDTDQGVKAPLDLNSLANMVKWTTLGADSSVMSSVLSSVQLEAWHHGPEFYDKVYDWCFAQRRSLGLSTVLLSWKDMSALREEGYLM